MRSLRQFLLSVLACSLLWVGPAKSAEITFVDWFECEAKTSEGCNLFPHIMLTGSIEKGDTERLESALTQYRKSVMESDQHLSALLRITSDGGNVEEALKLSKLIRDTRIRVYATDKCSSACFYLYASAVDRDSDDDTIFGLHRPYFKRDAFSNLSSSQADFEYRQLENDVKRHLYSVRVPLSVIEKMLAYNSSEAWLVTGIQMSSMINEYDAAHEEWILAKCSEQAMNPNEYDLAKKLVMRSCNDYPSSGGSMTNGYCEYLLDKYSKFHRCRTAAVFEEQYTFFKKLDDIP